MIKSIGEYRYVTGDLGKIKIDGGIMPLRSDDNKKDIRGEDIAFLLESICEISKCRYNAKYPSENFSRQILASQPVRIASFLAGQLTDNSGWVKEGYDFQSKEIIRGTSVADAYPENFYGKSSLSSDGSSFYPGAKLEMAPIQALFDDMAKLRRFDAYGTKANPTNHVRTQYVNDKGSGEGDYQGISPRSADIISYSMEMTGTSRYFDEDPFGCVMYKGTGGSVSCENQNVSSVIFVVRFDVEGSDHSSSYSKQAFASVPGTKYTGGHFSVTSATLSDVALNEVLPAVGVRIIPYPGRTKGVDVFQELRVTVSGVDAICEMGSRTKFT